MDFATPTNDAALAWARLGVPDLLGVELAAFDWEVLDRESIGLVTRELSLTDDIQAGHLLGAEYVVSGRVSIPEPGRLLIEGSLTKVEGLETVRSVSQTGAYPKELGEVIQTLAGELTAATGSRIVRTPDRAEEWIPKPEALIFFYRGLSAYSAGYPEAAATWFISASRMDKKFVAAVAWEIRAFEAAGFPDMAERVRVEKGHSLPELNKSEDAETHALTLARPLLMPAKVWTAEQTREIMNVLSTGLSQHKDVSLINPEAMERAIREQDTQLSGLFSSATTARYGRWRIPDGILKCRIERKGDSVNIQLRIDALATAGSVVREEKNVAMAKLVKTLPRLLDQLLTRWGAEGIADVAQEVHPGTVPIPETALEGLSKQYRSLGPALNRLRQTRGFEEWKAVADAFRQIDYGPMGGLAIDRAIEHIDLDAADADLVLHHMWRWLYGAGLRPKPPVRYASPAILAGLETNLLTRFPNSICAGALWYEQGRIAWRDKRYGAAAACMEKALAVLVLGRADYEDRIILAAKYVRADSLGHQGLAEEAYQAFRAVQEQIQQHPTETSFLPVGVYINNNRRFAGGGGNSLALEALVEDAIRKYASMDFSVQTPLERLAVYARTHSISIDEAGHDFVAPALNTLIEAWQTSGPLEVEGQSDLNLVRFWLPILGKVASEPERREWFPKFLDAYLRRVGLVSAGTFEQAALSELVPHVGTLWPFFEAVQLRQEGLDFIDRFLNSSEPPDLAFRALSQIGLEVEEWTSRLAQLSARLPGGERDIPGVLWMRLASQCLDDQDWTGAWTAMRKSFVSAKPASPGDETARLLIHQAANQRSENLHDVVKAECGELGLLPWIPRWWQWYNTGKMALEEGEYMLAAECFQVVLRFLSAPQEMDPTLSIEPASRFCVEHLRQGEDRDTGWIREQVSRRNSARFHLAVCFLELNEPDQAAILLREVALEVGQDRSHLFREIYENRSSYFSVHLGVLSSTLLHSLHLLNDIQWAGMPVLDRAEVAQQCLEAGRELKRARFGKEAHFFFNAAKRLKSPSAELKRENGMGSGKDKQGEAHGKAE